MHEPNYANQHKACAMQHTSSSLGQYMNKNQVQQEFPPSQFAVAREPSERACSETSRCS